MVAVQAQIVYVPVSDPGIDVDVRTIPVEKDKLYVDTIFESDTPDRGGPFVIGHCNGRAISVGYDYNYLMHIVYSDGEPVISDGALRVVPDSLHNRATFCRAGRSIDIDFDKADAIERLDGFVGSGKDRVREYYSYVLGDSESQDFVCRSTFMAEIPVDKAQHHRLFDIIAHRLLDKDGKVEPDYYWDRIDTVYYVSPRPEINSFKDLVRVVAQHDCLNSGKYSMPLAADSMVAPMTGFVSLEEYIPVFITDTLMTVNTVVNNAYPAGGCCNSYELYTTYVTRGDTIARLTPEDVFCLEQFDRIKKVFVEHLSMELAGTNRPVTDLDDYRNIYNIYSSMIPYDAQLPAGVRENIVEYAKSYISSGDYGLLRMPDIALMPDGVMMAYDLSCLTDFGEDSFMAVFVPYNEIEGCFRPGWLAE